MRNHLVFSGRIARGESSDIFRATRGNEQFAVKVLHPHLADDPIVRSRFIRNAEILGVIEHPHIVRVYDLTEYEGRPAMVMEFLDGPSLTPGGMSPRDAMTMLSELLDALSAIHGRGIVHRDIRPSHILRDPGGSFRLTDFGMASIRDLSGLTRSTVFTSRPQYVDPFSWGAGIIDPAQDLYSLGAVLFECLTGTPPPVTLFSKDEADRRRAMDAFSGQFDHFVTTLVSLLLEEPGRRPRSAAEVLQWIDDGRLAGARVLGECLHCGAPMPTETPLCPGCGRMAMDVRSDENGEFISLRKISEQQEVLGPFLRKLRLLSGDDTPIPQLITSDIRLYSKDERKNSMRLPVRIAEGLDSASVGPLITLLQGDQPTKITIRRHPMSARGRVKRGPLITVRSGPKVVRATVDALRGLRSIRGSGSEPEQRLRTECSTAIAIAIRRLADQSGDSIPVDPAIIDELDGILGAAVDHLERSERYLKAVNLQATYADMERSMLLSNPRDGVLQKTDKIFHDYASAEQTATRTRHRIVEACRRLETIHRPSLSGDLEDVRALLRETTDTDATD